MVRGSLIQAVSLLLLVASSAYAGFTRVAVLGLRDEMRLPGDVARRLDGALASAITDRLGGECSVLAFASTTDGAQDLLKPCPDRTCERSRGARLGGDYLIAGDISQLRAGLRMRLRAYQLAGNDFLLEEVVMAPSMPELETRIAALCKTVCDRVMSDVRENRTSAPMVNWPTPELASGGNGAGLAPSGAERIAGLTEDPSPAPSPSPSPPSGSYEEIRRKVTERMKTNPPLRIRPHLIVMSEGSQAAEAELAPMAGDRIDAGGHKIGRAHV